MKRYNIICEVSFEAESAASADEIMTAIFTKAGYEVSEPLMRDGRFLVRIPSNVQGDHSTTEETE